jgi:hypothetical protein
MGTHDLRIRGRAIAIQPETYVMLSFVDQNRRYNNTFHTIGTSRSESCSRAWVSTSRERSSLEPARRIPQGRR